MVETRWPRKRALEIDVRRVCQSAPHLSWFKVVQADQLYYFGGCDFELEVEIASQKCFVIQLKNCCYKH